MKPIVLSLFLIFQFVLFPDIGVAVQQNPPNWSEPNLVYTTKEKVTMPILVVDAYGTVHLFWVLKSYADENQAFPNTIMHSALENGVWSAPIDILVDPTSFGTLEVAASPTGKLYLLWAGDRNLTFSSVDARKANNPNSWQKPIVLANSFATPGISVAGNEVLVAFPGFGQAGVYFMRSVDEGVSWDGPFLVTQPADNDSAPDYVHLAEDQEGNIHIVWTEYTYPIGWPPKGIYYSRSEDHGKSWTEPYAFAKGSYDQITIGVSKTDDLDVLYNGAIDIGGRYLSSSRDHGSTWSDAEIVIPLRQGGTSGYPDMVFDSQNNLHFVTALDRRAGIVYRALENSTWTDPVRLSTDFIGQRMISVEFSRLAIQNGNTLYATYEVGFQNIYVVTRQLSVPAIAPLNTPMPVVPTLASTLPPKSTPTKISTLVPGKGWNNFNDSDRNSSLPIALGSIIAIVLIAGVAFIYTRRKMSQR
jgi:hypothetical protein